MRNVKYRGQKEGYSTKKGVGQQGRRQKSSKGPDFQEYVEEEELLQENLRKHRENLDGIGSLVKEIYRHQEELQQLIEGCFSINADDKVAMQNLLKYHIKLWNKRLETITAPTFDPCKNSEIATIKEIKETLEIEQMLM